MKSGSTRMEREERAGRVVELLAAAYPEAVCELGYGDPWQLLVATVLSAQCTDERVNRVTPELFARWPGPADLARARLADIEAVIRTTGLHRTKARSLRAAAHLVAVEHGGAVPRDLPGLIVLPGVGRKTAKVVLGEAFGVAAGIAVDTHVRRLSRRLGIASADDPEKIAAELEQVGPRNRWIELSLRLILHGRRVCTARAPKCGECHLREACANPEES